jgi:flagellar basal body-associated protein FliL
MKKKIIITISAILICVLFAVIIVNTYSRYRTSTSGTTNITIAKWNIKVNNQTIKNNSDLSTVISPVFPGTNDINANVIAPTAEGYFDLNIDYSVADVSFDYEISVSPNENSSVQDLILTGYSLDGGTTIISINSNPLIQGSCALSDNPKTKTVRVYIKWDDENGTMTNAEDTATTVPENATALLDVNISFIQNPNLQ